MVMIVINDIQPFFNKAILKSSIIEFCDVDL